MGLYSVEGRDYGHRFLPPLPSFLPLFDKKIYQPPPTLYQKALRLTEIAYNQMSATIDFTFVRVVVINAG